MEIGWLDPAGMTHLVHKMDQVCWVTVGFEKVVSHSSLLFASGATYEGERSKWALEHAVLLVIQLVAVGAFLDLLSLGRVQFALLAAIATMS